ncbi:MAG: RNA-binding protein [Pseudomonadota bacterium]|nr:RNA-binding protein [Pseudomonadota bacterium]
MHKIYVGNLPYTVDEDELRSMFEQFGSVDSVNLIIDRDTGRSKGFGFVSFEDKSAMSAALSLNDTEIQGRKLRVNEARERTGGDRGDRGGDRRGGDRGDRR